MTCECQHSRAYHKVWLQAQRFFWMPDQGARVWAQNEARKAVAEFMDSVQGRQCNRALLLDRLFSFRGIAQSVVHLRTACLDASQRCGALLHRGTLTARVRSWLRAWKMLSQRRNSTQAPLGERHRHASTQPRVVTQPYRHAVRATGPSSLAVRRSQQQSFGLTDVLAMKCSQAIPGFRKDQYTIQKVAHPDYPTNRCSPSEVRPSGVQHARVAHRSAQCAHV